jgi:hypothetical protein
MRKIKPFTVPVARLRDDGLLEIEDDLADVYRAIAELLVKRYGKKRRSNFIGSRDLEDKQIGVVGQFMFQSLLNQLRIPHISDNPVFVFREHRILWDFLVPNLGSIEVKTFRPTDHYFMVKKNLWLSEVEGRDEPDYVVALRLLSSYTAKPEGWLFGSEVSKLPVSEKGGKLTPFCDAYFCRFEELRPFPEFLARLKKCSLSKCRS